MLCERFWEKWGWWWCSSRRMNMTLSMGCRGVMFWLFQHIIEQGKLVVE